MTDEKYLQALQNADERTLKVMLDLSKDYIDDTIKSRDKLGRKYLLFVGFCFGYIVFASHLLFEPVGVGIALFLMVTSGISALFALALILFSIKTSRYSTRAEHPENVSRIECLETIYPYFISTMMQEIAIKAADNMKINAKKATVFNVALYVYLALLACATIIIFV